MSFFKGGKGSGRNQGDTRSSISINQTAHGFTVPQAVYLDDGDSLYKLAKADVLATANAIGVVSGVQDANNFTLTTAGAKNIFSGLTEGETFYVSDTVAGGLTNVMPSFSRPVLNAISATEGIIFTDAVAFASAGGNDTEVLFNNAGVIDGDPSFTFDETTKLLTVEDAIIENDLTVRGTTTSFNSENVNISDNHLILNAGNIVFGNASGGLVVNTGMLGSSFPISGAGFTPGIASTSNPTVQSDTASFSTNDIIEISGTLHNNGVYEVLSFSSGIITVRGIGNTPTVEAFTNNQFQTESAVGQVVKINATVLITNTDNKRIWGEATGSTTSLSSPFVFDYFNEGNLPYVVGKSGGNVPYLYNTIQSAIDAIEAVSAVDSLIVVTPGTYTEDLSIASTTLAITSLANENDITSIVGDIVITADAPLTTSNISIDGMVILGSVATLGSVLLQVNIGHSFINHSSAGDTIGLGNTNSSSVFVGNNTKIQQSFVGNAIRRTVDNTTVFLNECEVIGDLNFASTQGGSLDLEDTTVQGQIDLSNSTITSAFSNLAVATAGTTPCLNLTSSGASIMTVGLLDVTGGGNAITPATGANFTFANVLTTAGTILTTAMGTRFKTDGVDLKSDPSGGSNFLNDTGVYSAPATLYTADGSTLVDRLFELLSNSRLTITSNNSAVAATATSRSILLMQSGDYTFGHDKLDGAGGITGLQRMSFNSGMMGVFDTINLRGLQYGADYSGNFLDLSLVNKAYTDQGWLSRSVSGAGDLTSSGKPILAVTDSSAPRTVTIATADVKEGRPFTVKDEGGLAGTNTITVTTPTISVTSVAAGSSGSDFLTSTVHNYSVGQVVVHAGFVDGTYNGLFSVTAIVSTTRYEVAAISFNATDTGTSNVAIDNVSSTTITADYGSLTLYCNDNQIFSVGT